jgi:hypothetical protein
MHEYFFIHLQALALNTHANAGNGYKLDSVAKYIVSKRVIKQIANSSLLLRCRPEVGFEIQKT